MKRVILILGAVATVVMVGQDKMPDGKPVISATGSLQTVISFAMTAADGTVYPAIPDWAENWIRKNEKKYPTVVFQKGNLVQGATNYLIVFSNSERDLSGFDAVVKTNTSTDVTPVSGRGVVTSNYGYTWNYTFQGTVQTTTTTTANENVPYTIRSRMLYATAYDQRGVIVSQHQHEYSTKQGGDPYNSFGHNLGNALRAINARGRLIDGVLKDIAGSTRKRP